MAAHKCLYRQPASNGNGAHRSIGAQAQAAHIEKIIAAQRAVGYGQRQQPCASVAAQSDFIPRQDKRKIDKCGQPALIHGAAKNGIAAKHIAQRSGYRCTGVQSHAAAIRNKGKAGKIQTQKEHGGEKVGAVCISYKNGQNVQRVTKAIIIEDTNNIVSHADGQIKRRQQPLPVQQPQHKTLEVAANIDKCGPILSNAVKFPEHGVAAAEHGAIAQCRHQ